MRADDPNTRRGRGFQTVPRNATCGAKIPPIRAQVELQNKGVSSLNNRSAIKFNRKIELVRWYTGLFYWTNYPANRGFIYRKICGFVDNFLQVFVVFSSF